MPKAKGGSFPPPVIHVHPGQGGPVSAPNHNDVLSGRGGRVNRHPGNVAFRALLRDFRREYSDPRTRKLEKVHVAARLVARVRGADPPGRFLKEDGENPGMWVEIGDVKAWKSEFVVGMECAVYFICVCVLFEYLLTKISSSFASSSKCRDLSSVERGCSGSSKCRDLSRIERERSSDNDRIHWRIVRHLLNMHHRIIISGENRSSQWKSRLCILPIMRFWCWVVLLEMDLTIITGNQALLLQQRRMLNWVKIGNKGKGENLASHVNELRHNRFCLRMNLE